MEVRALQIGAFTLRVGLKDAFADDWCGAIVDEQAGAREAHRRRRDGVLGARRQGG
jgi:hypothetical protein